MINVKRFFVAYGAGMTVTCSVQRVADGFYLQASDGTFAVGVSSLPMVEALAGGYVLSEDRTVWDNGLYDVVFYETSTTIGGYEFQVAQDQILNGVALAALSAKNAVSSVAGGIKLINSTIAEQAKQLSILTGQVNDYSAKVRRANGT